MLNKKNRFHNRTNSLMYQS